MITVKDHSIHSITQITVQDNCLNCDLCDYLIGYDAGAEEDFVRLRHLAFNRSPHAIT